MSALPGNDWALSLDDDDGICRICNRRKKLPGKNVCKVCFDQRRRYNTVAQRKARTGCDRKCYDERLEAQKGVCAICGMPPGKRQLAADHDHATKKVRGLLCASCNIALGLMKDCAERLRKAAEYLESHR